MLKHLFFLFFLSVFLQKSIAQAPVILSVSPVSDVVERWDKFEAHIVLTAAYTNPYNYDEISVTALFTDPDGQQVFAEGFYMESFYLQTTTGALTPVAAGNGFRVRFAPRKTGTWTYTINCTTPAGTASFPAGSFQCVSPSNALAQGFVQAGQSNFLAFETGKNYIPVGENMCWHTANPYLDYTKWVKQLAANGGNFIRLWLAHWGLGLEWKSANNGFGGLRKYNQSNARYLDRLLDDCANQGVYVMLCINHHGQVSSQVNANWSESPYNAANGGMCQNPWDFFSNEAAKNAHKNRLRYILARWGYARSIMTWELFNEVNWTDNFELHRPAIADWHAEMAAFVKNNDPARRPVSTSYGTDETEQPEVWANPDLDYTQRHYYINTPNLEVVLAAGVRDNLVRYDKPTLIGEFGLTGDGTALANTDPTGTHLHNCLWGSLFGGGLGTGMSWWWDSYIEPQHLYYHFRGISEVTSRVQWGRAGLEPAVAEVSGAPADLRFNPSLGWAAQTDTLIQISSQGVFTPADYRLSTFFYGKQWNNQYSRPLVFKVDMPQTGKFRITTGAQFGTAPRLVVWLDGHKTLEIAPVVNTTYEVIIPSGDHTIKVDNIGTDWMQIVAYSFEGLGSAVDAYILQSSDKKYFAGWLLNSKYNHAVLKANGVPEPVSGALLQIDNINNGVYILNWFNCQTGSPQGSETVVVQDGRLSTSVPELIWDVAFTLEEQLAGIADSPARCSFEVFPNPAFPGANILLTTNISPETKVGVALLNAGGMPVERWGTRTAGGNAAFEFSLRADLPAGVYWIEMEAAGGQREMKLLNIVR